MSDKKAVFVVMILSLGLLVFWGCQDKRPTSPAKPLSLTVSVPVNDAVHAALLGSSTNEVLYVVARGNETLLKGNTGTFASSSVTGAVNFTFETPAGSDEVLSVQLNDGSTHQPLAVGAMSLDLSSGAGAASVSLQLGSLTRNCYYLKNTSGYPGYTIGFNGFNLSYPSWTYGTNFDTAFVFDSSYTNTGNYLIDAAGDTVYGASYKNSIAYLGNGDMIDFDYIPDSSRFYYDSWEAKYYTFNAHVVGSVPKGKAGIPTDFDVEAGDVYCVALNTIPGGHAWIQIVDPGVANSLAPSVRYRVNDTLPYFQYFQTPADAATTYCYGF